MVWHCWKMSNFNMCIPEGVLFHVKYERIDIAICHYFENKKQIKLNPFCVLIVIHTICIKTTIII